MKWVEQYSFHEATVKDINCFDSYLNIVIEDALAYEKQVNLSVKVNFFLIKADGKYTNCIQNLTSDGEIISFEQINNTLHLIIEWNNFQTKWVRTVSYEIEVISTEVMELNDFL